MMPTALRGDEGRGTELEVVINDFISRELVQDPALLPLGNATSLLDTGVLDSLNLLRLVVFIQERFGIVVNDVDLVPENFDTVDVICACLRSWDGKASGRAGGHG
jgi:acyl carrier protein